MKLRELVLATEALARLAMMELPAPIAFKVARTVRPLALELQTYEAQRVKLIQKFGERRENQFTVLAIKRTEFDKEYEALLDVDIEIEIMKLLPDMLDELKVTPADLILLWFLFEEGE